MRFSVIAASAALVATVSAQYANYTTEIVTAYTTYCPESTQITHGSQTYTVTEATTLTITNCPCTITHPVTAAPVVPASSGFAAPSGASAPVYSNSTAATASTPAASTPVASTTAAAFTGAANKGVVASGASLAGLFAVAAYLL
ncbi:hypothetical protein MMC20_006779 [Loxospora ochrophaea]|nr:hypothetical protein [Loxospora ochrophaea]